MGMLFRMFAPKSAKKVRRAAHPVERDDAAAGAQGEGAGEDVANPVGGVKRAGKRRAVRSVRGSKWF